MNFRGFAEELEKIASTEQVAQAAADAAPGLVKKVLPKAAWMAGGAVAFDQGRKAVRDWNTGRAYRMNAQQQYGM